MQPSRQIPRRTVLGVALLAAAGCHGHSGAGATAGPSPSPTGPPDATAMAQARRAEAGLLAAYDARISRATSRQLPQLEVERAVHATHLTALGGGTVGARRLPAHGSLTPVLLASARRLRRLSLAATSGGNAALLASVAASHEARAR